MIYTAHCSTIIVVVMLLSIAGNTCSMRPINVKSRNTDTKSQYTLFTGQVDGSTTKLDIFCCLCEREGCHSQNISVLLLI